MSNTTRQTGGGWGRAVAVAVVVHCALFAAVVQAPKDKRPRHVPPVPVTMVSVPRPPPAPPPPAPVTTPPPPTESAPKKKPVPAKATPAPEVAKPVEPESAPPPEPVKAAEPVVEAPPPAPPPLQVAPAAVSPEGAGIVVAPKEGVALGQVGGVAGGEVGGVKGGVVGGQKGGQVAPSTAPPSGPVRLTRNDQPAKVIQQTKPVYPRMAQLQGVEGTVMLMLVVDVNGKVVDARVLSGPSIFTAAAVEAVKEWRFTPARRADGKLVPSYLPQPVVFRLR